MPILLYCVGAICFAAGFALAAYGIPVSEFSFGNTLIVAGTTIATGGLIVFALGTVVSRLQQLVEAGGAVHMPATLPHSPEAQESASPLRAPEGRVSFPPRPKAETFEVVAPAAAPEESRMPEPEIGAPTLPNPDEPPASASILEVEKEPKPSSFVAESAFDKEWPPAPPSPERRPRSGFKWPERKPVKPIVEETPVAPVEPALVEPLIEETPAAPVQQAEETPESLKERPAVLKSGVVDGMGYTLYVDGSIEAELPQGTLRFASINELREHLEQNS